MNDYKQYCENGCYHYYRYFITVIIYPSLHHVYLSISGSHVSHILPGLAMLAAHGLNS